MRTHAGARAHTHTWQSLYKKKQDCASHQSTSNCFTLYPLASYVHRGGSSIQKSTGPTPREKQTCGTVHLELSFLLNDARDANSGKPAPRMALPHRFLEFGPVSAVLKSYAPMVQTVVSSKRPSRSTCDWTCSEGCCDMT